MTFAYSKTGLQLTEQFEGCRLTAYQDSVGVWTIGYGHTGPDVYRGLTITQERAEQLLLQDVAKAAAAVNRLVTLDRAGDADTDGLPDLTQDEFDALVDFTFNLGAGRLANSTLLKKLNAGDIEGAAAEFPKWVYAGGKVLAGLVKRRDAERALFLLGAHYPK
ncbi:MULTISPECIES: lysozyme [Burkholderia]|uniref:lysozyme n=1 Tax=Burkholderia TaxID=32008 RepID=UPI000B79D71B|nr:MULTISPECIES: lysozyme [Burkholderia]MBY4725720.1 lysozyme [Burkholderia contaminans]MCI3969258.1 lysozyme [Burkholderia sp. HI4860]OXI98492.1 muraminidase [Burkholderia sp. AU33647]